jgi:DNA-binding response OmpR family regulator
MIPVTHLLPVEQVALRLADEGVPLRVIARTLHTPSDTIRRQLRAAHDTGALIDLPKEDWPPGFPRDQRALQLSRLVMEDREAVMLSVQRIFHLTSTEVALFMLLLQHPCVPKSRINLATRTIDVHVYNIRRRLIPFGIAIATLWGYGYQLSSDSRQRIMDLILARDGVPA